MNHDSTSSNERAVLAGFMRFLAHELGNPVATIRMSSEMLLGGVPSDLHTQLSQMILDEAIHLERLVEAAVFFTSLSSPSRAHTDLVQLVEQAVARRDGSAEYEVVHLNGAVTINADIAQIARLLDETLANALDAGAHRVRIETALDSNDVLLTVSDDGDKPAIEPPTRIFDPFYTTREGRLGLGASIAKRVAELHGGGASVRVNDESETEITYRIPLNP